MGVFDKQKNIIVTCLADANKIKVETQVDIL